MPNDILINFSGNCGDSQPAANDFAYLWCFIFKCPKEDALGSHSLCNDFYVSAFENDFVAKNVKNCAGVNSAETTPDNFKMGYMEKRRSSLFQGVFAAATVKDPPYNFVP